MPGPPNTRPGRSILMAAPRLSDEEKERLAGGEAAAKKAARAPAGSEDLSGAAPGIKGRDRDPDDVEAFDQPASARRAQRRADKRMDEVRDIQRDVQSRNLLENVPPENVQTVFGTKDGNKDPGSMTLANVGNALEVTLTGNPTFVGDDRLAVVRAVNAAASGF